MINIEQCYQKLIPFYCKKFKLSNIIIKKDNRIRYSASVKYYKKSGMIIYNSKRLNKDRSYDWGLATMFHELGHLKYKLPYITRTQKVLSEYKAETFALKQMKKYYFKRYKRLNKCVIRKILPFYKKDFPIHYEAFLKTKEYQIVGK